MDLNISSQNWIYNQFTVINPNLTLIINLLNQSLLFPFPFPNLMILFSFLVYFWNGSIYFVGCNAFPYKFTIDRGVSNRRAKFGKIVSANATNIVLFFLVLLVFQLLRRSPGPKQDKEYTLKKPHKKKTTIKYCHSVSHCCLAFLLFSFPININKHLLVFFLDGHKISLNSFFLTNSEKYE